jgi:tetratricopeptide (TPR) repeat protein
MELEKGRFQQAADLLRPEAEDAEAMERVLAAIAAEELGRGEEAEAYLAAAAEADESVARMAYWSGRQKAREAQAPGSEGPETEEPVFEIGAERWYLLAARLAPDDPHFLNDLGYHLAEEGILLDTAVELLRRAVALSEAGEGEADANVLDSLAWALHGRGDHEEALEVMKRCLRVGGLRTRLDETSCYHLGAIYGALGFTGLACEELQKVALAEEPAEDDESEKATAWRLLREYRGEEGGPGS